MLLQSSETDM